MTGEAKFLRAFCYFYLVNLFGDVPLLTTTDFASNSIAPRTPVNQVYDQIIADLKQAVNILPFDYSNTNGERIRATKWAASALLARVYLYTGKYADAETQATLVINNPAYNLVTISPSNNGFQKNNSEAILQLQSNNSTTNWPYATREAYDFVPVNNTVSPNYYLTPE